MLIAAYVAVLLLSPVACVLVTGLASMVFGIGLFWLPRMLRSRVASVVAGVLGVGGAIAISRFAFHAIAGPGTFQLAPFLAALVPAAFVAVRQHSRGKAMREAERDLPMSALAGASFLTDGVRFSAYGYFAGIMAAIGWFFFAAS